MLAKKDSNIVKGFYDSIHYVTQGAGQIDFKLYPTDKTNELKAIVTSIGFRDTTVQLFIDLNNNNSSSFSTLDKAMNNEIQINGDFKQLTLLTGTWTYICMISNNKKTEVTNITLRDSLILFGQFVRNGIMK